MSAAHRKNGAELAMAAAAAAIAAVRSVAGHKPRGGGMRQYDIALPAGATDWPTIEQLCLTAALHLRLTVGPRQTLKSKPGSVHYHLTSPGQTGVLELTLWPAKQKLWLSVHANRHAAWIDEVTTPVATAISDAVMRQFARR